MVSINARGIAQDHLPVFPEYVDAQARGAIGTIGAGRKQAETSAVLSSGTLRRRI